MSRSRLHGASIFFAWALPPALFFLACSAAAVHIAKGLRQADITDGSVHASLHSALVSIVGRCDVASQLGMRVLIALAKPMQINRKLDSLSRRVGAHRFAAVGHKSRQTNNGVLAHYPGRARLIDVLPHCLGIEST